MADMHSDAVREEYYGEQPVSVSHLAHVLRRYSGVIAIVLTSVVLLYLIIGTTAYLRSSQQKVVSMPFRLEFSGGALGQYPNGLKFSVADITATPVLLDVFNVNELARFTTFDSFSRSLYVVESNLTLEGLTREYEAKLADPKLTQIDRDRFEREFGEKRAGINKSDYAIQYLATPKAGDIPTSVIRKVLTDVLSTWARRAAVEKRVLDYQISIVGPSILDNMRITGNDYLIPLLLLRHRVDTITSNAASVADMPGAKLIRTAGRRASIAEVQLRLGEIIRFRLEPLIANAQGAGFFGSNVMALQVLRAQLKYDERMLTSAKLREDAIRNALITYQSQQPQQIGAGGRTDTAQSPAIERGAGETVMPQLSDTFLDRVVDMANRNADREYRQKLTDEIKFNSLAVVPAQASVQYDQELIDSFTKPSTPTAKVGAVDLKSQWDVAVAEVRDAIVDLNQIYSLLSKQLYPETQIYRITAAPMTRIDRTLTLMRLALYGLLVFFIALPLTIVFVFLHNRIREEEAAEERDEGRGEQAAVTS
jgi:hypothetical protein